MKKKLTNINHVISRYKKTPGLISNNISVIIRVAKLEAILSGYCDGLSEKQLINDYKNGLEILSMEYK